ncbi:MAG TPA: tetratricopeptide repeat protein [Mycobacteriales bacterium]|nr:tetratricopeptide repeat protein [Mycobacteriales bacterium]
MPSDSHRWLAGGLASDRAELYRLAGLGPALLPPVPAYRRLRGPYTAAGTMLRVLVPEALRRWPDLVAAHDVEILTVAPELRSVVPASRETLTSLAVPSERTRFYSRLRTLRLAHGLTEFLRDHLRRLDAGPHSLLIEGAEHADSTDQELLAVLLRRLDPALLTLAIGTGTRPGPGPGLAEALRRHAVELTPAAVPALPRPAGVVDAVRLAQRYVDSDGTSDESRLRAAYHGLEPAHRARLHDERAAELESRDELSLLLGAVPYHRERGSDPAGVGAQALRFALDYCIDHGFYEATVDCGHRGRRLVDSSTQLEMWWAYTTKMTTSLAALGRAQEAEDLYDEARASSTSPSVHLQAAYATAMLYTRHHPDSKKDHRRAKAWINAAIAFSSMLPDPQERAFQTVFNQNGLALIEVHLRNLPAALRLVDSGLSRLDKDLDPAEHRLHRSVLRYNRAQVYAGLGRLDEALADYTGVIEADPNYAEYYFDRGGILRKLGRDDEALADYERAMALSPPYPEVYYNRADLLLDRGDLAAARADFDYVLELDPGYLDALINRAGLLCELDEWAAARRDVDAGLELAPGDPHLHCLLGRLESEAGDPAAARAAFTAALTADPTLQAAWANRATLAFETGDIPAALDDLSRALAIEDDADLRINRATAYQAAGDLDSALIDLARARDLGAPEADDLLAALPASAQS